MRKFLLLLLISSLMFTKCTYDNEEDFYVCDTLEVQYSTVVKPLLEDNGCIGCHNSFTSEGDIVLDDYESLVAVADSVLGAIQHKPGYVPMPRDGSKMDECSINQIKAWINDGMPNN